MAKQPSEPSDVVSRQLPSLYIGQLARKAGVKPDTVRFYEKNGLMPSPARTGAGYRVYDGAALARLRFIRTAQSLGFTLDEIQRILRLRGYGRETCRCVIAMAEATLEETERKLAELHSFRDGLKQTLDRWRRVSNPRVPMVAEFCELIESTHMEVMDHSI
jgi:DNA-binding transcriptional MerR regulator